MIYTFSIWLFFFYFYCFIGWVWETCYVSVCEGRWVNRGFLHGPFLPIYGSGAVIVLVFTLPFRATAWLVFVAGMVSATVLEYITGVVMEKLFHVRYWDYSDKPLNINGHICFLSSLAWGVFSIMLTLFGHTLVERLAFSMNGNVLEFIVFVLTAYISIDVYESVREAVDLKELLEAIEQSGGEFRHLQRGLEVAYAFYGKDIKEKSEEGLRKLNSALETGKEKYGSTKETLAEKVAGAKRNEAFRRMNSLLGRNPKAVSKMHPAAFGEFKEALAQRREKKKGE